MRADLESIGEQARARLGAMHLAREDGIARCRTVIRASGLAIRAIHRLDPVEYKAQVEAAELALRQAQEAVSPYPRIAHAGFLHDAEKEYAEARLTAALVNGSEACDADELGVGVPAWFNGLAEAASELRRHLLDRLREGSEERAINLLRAMEDVYDLLVAIDYPDAVNGGLRRATDALRAVLERSRADVTTTVLQSRLRAALESHQTMQEGPGHSQAALT